MTTTTNTMDIALFVTTALVARTLVAKRNRRSQFARNVGKAACSFRQNQPKEIKITMSLLKQQNAQTSQAIIEHYTVATHNSNFAKLSEYEGKLCLQRDREDDDKLAKGIEVAESKGVVDPNFVPEPYVTIDVLGKSPTEVASLILDNVNEIRSSSSYDTSEEGFIIVLVGLSGTGKGTTVTKLREILESHTFNKKVVTWSNGNIFRSFTLLAVKWCEQNNKNGKFDAAKALTKDNLAKFSQMLSFHKKKSGVYDTRISGLGIDAYVNDIQNTELKSPQVAKNIPAVAEMTQGEVITFAASAASTLGKAGYVVLLEGREQTVNYVRTPYRFTLTLSDESLIGKRRAAQRIMAATLQQKTENLWQAMTKVPGSIAEVAAVIKALDETLDDMVDEMH